MYTIQAIQAIQCGMQSSVSTQPCGRRNILVLSRCALVPAHSAHPAQSWCPTHDSFAIAETGLHKCGCFSFSSSGDESFGVGDEAAMDAEEKDQRGKRRKGRKGKWNREVGDRRMRCVFLFYNGPGRPGSRRWLLSVGDTTDPSSAL